MEQINLNCLFKNRPLPSKDTYRKKLIHKLEIFIKRIRLKALFEKKNKSTNEVITNLGFKSVKAPPKKLNQFEGDLYDMIQNIEFKIVTTNF